MQGNNDYQRVILSRYLDMSTVIFSVLCLIIHYFQISLDHLSIFLPPLFIVLLTFHCRVEIFRYFCKSLTNLPKGLLLWVISPIHCNDLNRISLKFVTVKPMLTSVFHLWQTQQIYYMQRNIMFSSSLQTKPHMKHDNSSRRKKKKKKESWSYTSLTNEIREFPFPSRELLW